jgi:hypothetical protein
LNTKRSVPKFLEKNIEENKNNDWEIKFENILIKANNESDSSGFITCEEEQISDKEYKNIMK